MVIGLASSGACDTGSLGVRMKTWRLFLVALVSVAVGVLAGVFLERHHETAEQRLRMALHEVEVAGLCANALRTREARPETERRLLELRMTSALTEADKSLVGAAQIPIAIPDLIEGVRRARQYAASKDMRAVVTECDRLLAALARRKERA